MQRLSELDSNSGSDVCPDISASPDISADPEPSDSKQPGTLSQPSGPQTIGTGCCAQPTGSNVRKRSYRPAQATRPRATPLDETATVAISNEQSSSCTKLVRAQTTDEHVDEERIYECTERTERHHRVVLAEVGRELTSFKSTREFLQVITHSIEGLTSMYFKAGIVHGSVSPQNIVITKDGKGKLIDWDIPRS